MEIIHSGLSAAGTPLDVREVAAAIVQRADQGHVLILSDPPTLEQRLHLMAAGIDGRPLLILTGAEEANGAQPNG